MKNKDQAYLKDELGRISGVIAQNQVLGRPVGKLRAEFARLSMQYKRYWLRNYRLRKQAVEKDGLHTLYKGRIIAK